ncbi:MAG: histidine phosphatase family protein [Myxococcota bacterium]
MILYLVRHGLTAWNAEGRSQGHADVPLSDVGRRQACALAGRLADMDVAAAYASDLSRAHETARILVEERGEDLDLVTTPALREMSLGDWEGLRRDEIDTRFPDVRARWAASPANCRLPNGETLSELQGRMVRFVEGLHDVHPDDAVLVVSHGFAILTFVCHALDLPLESFRRLWMDPTGVTEIRLRGDRFSLRRLNDTAHLEGDPSLRPERRRGIRG